MIFCNITYFSALITWPRYYSFLIVILFNVSYSSLILSSNSSFVTIFTQLILNIPLYDHISNAFSRLLIVF